jgi:hypothetical protein
MQAQKLGRFGVADEALACFRKLRHINLGVSVHCSRKSAVAG